jgi:hypothetical protein
MSAFEGILLKNFRSAGRQFSRQKTRQAAIVDGGGVKLVSEVASEFITM